MLVIEGAPPVMSDFCCLGDSGGDPHDDRTSVRDCIPESAKGTNKAIELQLVPTDSK